MHAVLRKLDPKALLVLISVKKKKSLHIFCLEFNHLSTVLTRIPKLGMQFFCMISFSWMIGLSNTLVCVYNIYIIQLDSYNKPHYSVVKRLLKLLFKVFRQEPMEYRSSWRWEQSQILHRINQQSESVIFPDAVAWALLSKMVLSSL